MTRRRLYSRLLVVSSGSGYLQAPRHVSMFTRHQASIRKLQVFLRHTFLTFFTSLQLSNKYILIDAPHTLTQLRRFRLNVWFYFLGAACRFIYSSVSLTVPALNPSSRHGLFYLWSLSWHFRYFRMPPQPLLTATRELEVCFYDPCQVLSLPIHFTYNRWSLLGFRVPQRAPVRLLSRLLECVASADSPREIGRELMYSTPAPRQTRLQLSMRSLQATLPVIVLQITLRLITCLTLSVYHMFTYKLKLIQSLN